MNDVLSGYSAASTELIKRFEAVASADVFAPVHDLLPKTPARIADIGAGTGRDAAWFAAKGHMVLAVEPVEELRVAGMAIHTDERIAWLDDRLPELSALRRETPFDLVTLCAVWQHLDDDEQAIALRHLAETTVNGGLLVMSLRHGAGAPGRLVFPISVDLTLERASKHGFSLLRAREVASVQAANRAAGVHWTWLAFQKVG